MDFVTALDQTTSQGLNSFVGHWPLFDRAIAAFADWRFVRCAPLVGFILWAWFRHSDSNARALLAAGCAGVTLSVMISVALQSLLFLHVRPFLMAQELGLRLPAKLPTNWGQGSSFPSDTATEHFALAALIWSVSRAWGIASLVWVTALIAVPRAYLLFHWPSDIVAAALLGFACVALLQNSKRCVRYAHALVGWEVRRPHFFYPLLFALLYQFVDAFDAVDVVLYHFRHPR